jgi:hypothetical protein
MRHAHEIHAYEGHADEMHAREMLVRTATPGSCDHTNAGHSFCLYFCS